MKKVKRVKKWERVKGGRKRGKEGETGKLTLSRILGIFIGGGILF